METDFLYDTVDGNMNSPFLSFSLVKFGTFYPRKGWFTP